eukprot:8120863-Heterocapsa_arctica.AAC.1
MHNLKDERAEWCREKGFVIQRVRGDGNCLYTCLGKSINLEGDQTRHLLIEKVNGCWDKIMEHDLDGSGLAHFIEGPGDINKWGGAEQIV